jgi:hypothetical protein
LERSDTTVTPPPAFLPSSRKTIAGMIGALRLAPGRARQIASRVVLAAEARAATDGSAAAAVGARIATDANASPVRTSPQLSAAVAHARSRSYSPTRRVHRGASAAADTGAADDNAGDAEDGPVPVVVSRAVWRSSDAIDSSFSAVSSGTPPATNARVVAPTPAPRSHRRRPADERDASSSSPSRGAIAIAAVWRPSPRSSDPPQWPPLLPTEAAAAAAFASSSSASRPRGARSTAAALSSRRPVTCAVFTCLSGGRWRVYSGQPVKQCAISPL